MREGRQLSNIAISPPSQPSLSRGNRLRKNLRRRESTDAMKRKCGGMRQASQIWECGKRGVFQIQKTAFQLRPLPRLSYKSETYATLFLAATRALMSQCDTSWTDTTMSQMSHPADTKNSFADTTGVPSQLQHCPQTPQMPANSGPRRPVPARSCPVAARSCPVAARSCPVAARSCPVAARS